MNLANHIKPASIVVLDNFFTSVSLKNIFACGTVRANSKGLPDFIKKPNKKIDKSMARGEFQFQVKERISAVKWMDKKLVSFLSSYHSPRAISRVRRKLRSGVRTELYCPKVVDTYNKSPPNGGVDRFDQLLERYSIGRRSIKWWHRILYYLIDLAIANTHLLWKLDQPKSAKCNHLSFRLTLAIQLINGFTSWKVRGRPPNFVKRPIPEEIRVI